MTTKIICIISLVLLIVSQILLTQGTNFNQQLPVDFAHWFLLLGAAMSLSFSFVFPKGIINTIATIMTIIGVIATIGMCAIDFTFWSFGDDFESRKELIIHLMNTPSIWYPFFVVGPAFLYAGLATYAWSFIKTNTLGAIITLLSSFSIGAGYILAGHGPMIVLGITFLAIGLLILVFRKAKPNYTLQIAQ